jgi:hypothetical protein
MGAVHIVLMENTLRFEDETQLRYVFDLKGSRVDREVKGYTKPSTTLKDINFMLIS